MILSACQGGGGEKSVIQKKPEWVYKTPESDQKYHYFTGLATECIKPEEAEHLAKQMAMEKCFEFIQVKGKSRYSAQRNENGRTFSDQFVMESGDITLQNIKEIDTHSEVMMHLLDNNGHEILYNHYVLLGLPKSEVQRIKKIQKDKFKTVLSLLAKSNELWDRNLVFLAWSNLQKAKQSVADLDQSLTTNVDGQILTVTALESQIKGKENEWENIFKLCAINIEDSIGLSETVLKENITEYLSWEGIQVRPYTKENLKYLHVLVTLKIHTAGIYSDELIRYTCDGKIDGFISNNTQVDKVFSLDPNSKEVLASNADFAAKQLEKILAKAIATQISTTLSQLSEQ